MGGGKATPYGTNSEGREESSRKSTGKSTCKTQFDKTVRLGEPPVAVVADVKQAPRKEQYTRLWQKEIISKI